jgi:thioredoxin reductase (NADPH)
MADALILGAGPAGLQAVFQLGLAGLTAEVIEARDAPGGLCAAYGDKPVYDMPGFVSVTGAEIASGLVAQAMQLKPIIHYGEKALRWEAGFRLICASGAEYSAPVLVVAGGARFAMDVEPSTCEYSPGLFAIGDAARYPGKTSYLIPAFHEAALMAHRAFAILKGAV